MISLRSISARSAGLAFLLSLSFACDRHRPTEGTRKYPITGTVVARDEVHSQLTIAHPAVPGLMPAMTMPFRVANLNPAVQPGHEVKGTLFVNRDGGWIEGLAITGKSQRPLPEATPPSDREPGREVPDFALQNQDGKPIGLEVFRGKAVMLTFIYTRCPLPDYCPRMMKNFNAVKRLLAQQPGLPERVHLLGVSIDPENDSPAVLRKWGQRMIPGDHPFEAWDLATGSPGEIRRMAQWFGLTYFYESGQINHTLSTAIIDPAGHLVKTMTSNSWSPEEAVATLRGVLR